MTSSTEDRDLPLNEVSDGVAVLSGGDSMGGGSEGSDCVAGVGGDCVAGVGGDCDCVGCNGDER